MSESLILQHRRWWALSIAAVVAYAGMILDYGQRLWALEYFQFYPVFVVAVLGLTISRVREGVFPDQRAWRIEPISLCLGVAALWGAGWIWSPWLAALSLLLLGDSLLSGHLAVRRCWRLLFLLLTLPMRLDEQLVHSLQRISSTYASTLLDRLNVPHLMRGNVLELADKRLFVEEACSGISSVYLLLAATAFYVVWARVRMIQAIPLILSVLWWSIVANIFRIVVIAAGIYFYGQDLTAGWQHETLGIFVLLLAMLGIYSTNNLLEFLLGQIRPDRNAQNKDPWRLKSVQFWNYLTAVRPQQRLATGTFCISLPRRPLLNTLTLLMILSGGWYWTNVVRAKVESKRPEDLVAAQIDDSQLQQLSDREFDLLDETVFESVSELTTDGFHTETRSALDDRNLFGARSHVWDVSTPFGKGLVAVDGPFGHWHDLRMCYESQGWKFEQTSVHPIHGQLPGRDLVTVRMIDVNGQRAHLHFCLVSPMGALMHAPVGDDDSSFGARIQERLANTIIPRDSGHWWQLQMLVQHDGQSLTSEVKAEQRLFAQLLALTLHRWKRSAGVDVP